MFNMMDIGRKIALFRKEKNLTQMELADMLNISYQAVSNWERGETMPDISKLPELAQILNTSIDDMLDNQKCSKIIENIIKGNKVENEITVEDFRSVAPLLKPGQIKEVSEGISPEDEVIGLIEYLPFVSRDVADKIAEKAIESEKLMLMDCMPFVSRKYANLLVMNAIDKNYDYRSLAECLPFVDREVADKIAGRGVETGCIMLNDFMPFVSRKYADLLVSKAMELNYDHKSLEECLPFVSHEMADKIAEKGIECGLISLDRCIHFVSRQFSDLLVLKTMDKAVETKP